MHRWWVWLGAAACIACGAFLAAGLARNWNVIVQSGIPPEERVRLARQRSEQGLREAFAQTGLIYPPREICFRAFKLERELELWAAPNPGEPMRRVRTWPIAGMSGGFGPKRREGDRQVPEGFYEIDRFNPRSNFWLSLGLNYPNASDRILSDAERPGGDIFIHGDTRSVGCLAMTDARMDGIYVVALDARTTGQRVIRVDLFPSREPYALADWEAHRTLWEPLQAALDVFEQHRRPVAFRVDERGAYVLSKTGD